MGLGIVIGQELLLKFLQLPLEPGTLNYSWNSLATNAHFPINPAHEKGLIIPSANDGLAFMYGARGGYRVE